MHTKPRRAGRVTVALSAGGDELFVGCNRHLWSRQPTLAAKLVPFGILIVSWLRDWAESLLALTRLTADWFVRAEPVRRAWAAYVEGAHNWQYPSWTVLMPQAWRARWA